MSLPPELVLVLASHLSPTDAFSFALTNSKLYGIYHRHYGAAHDYCLLAHGWGKWGNGTGKLRLRCRCSWHLRLFKAKAKAAALVPWSLIIFGASSTMAIMGLAWFLMGYFWAALFSVIGFICAPLTVVLVTIVWHRMVIAGTRT